MTTSSGRAVESHVHQSTGIQLSTRKTSVNAGYITYQLKHETSCCTYGNTHFCKGAVDISAGS